MENVTHQKVSDPCIHFSGIEYSFPTSTSTGGGREAKEFHVLRTDRRAGVGLHSVVAEESCYSMLIRIWFDVVAIKVAKST